MDESKIGYTKSSIDIQIKFDEDREREFKEILDEMFEVNKNKRDSDEDEIANKVSLMEADFDRRAAEIRWFTRQSKCAANSPLLNQAMVRRTKRALTFTQVNGDALTPLQRFRSLARLVVIFITLSLRWKRYDLTSVLFSDSNIGSETPTTRYFRTASDQLPSIEKKKITKVKSRISDDLVRILRSEPNDRCKDDLSKIQKFCRKIGALSNFPVEREQDVACCIGYECYDKGRVLCMQGRTPIRFYYILGGKVKKVKTIELTAGIKKQYFGELHQGNTTDPNELQLNKQRQCSLVAKSFVEVLVIEREDFMDLLLTKSLMDNSNSTFLRTLGMFQTFPLDTVEQETMTTKYFPKDTVVVKNLKESAYFYVIKSGTCKLLQKQTVDKSGVPIAKRDTIPKLDRHLMTLSASSGSTEGRLTFTEAKQLHKDVSSFLSGAKQWQHEPIEEEESMTKEIQVRSVQKKMSLSVTQPKMKKPVTKHHKNHKAIPTLGELVFGTKEDEQNGSSYVDEISSKVEMELKLPLITLDSSFVNRKSISTERSSKMSTIVPPNWMKRNNDTKEKQEREAFFQIGILKTGDIYGLESLTKRAASMIQSDATFRDANKINEPIVVSEGTECILVNKRRFLKSADFCTLARIAQMDASYTPAHDAKMQIEKARNWGRYKKTLMRDILQRGQNKRKIVASR